MAGELKKIAVRTHFTFNFWNDARTHQFLRVLCLSDFLAELSKHFFTTHAMNTKHVGMLDGSEFDMSKNNALVPIFLFTCQCMRSIMAELPLTLWWTEISWPELGCVSNVVNQIINHPQSRLLFVGHSPMAWCWTWSPSGWLVGWWLGHCNHRLYHMKDIFSGT